MLLPLISRVPMEEQLSREYTINIFRRFLCELYKCMGCTTKLIKMDALLFAYGSNNTMGINIHHEVFYNEEDNEVKYIYCEFDLEVFCSRMLCSKRKDI